MFNLSLKEKQVQLVVVQYARGVFGPPTPPACKFEGEGGAACVQLTVKCLYCCKHEKFEFNRTLEQEVVLGMLVAVEFSSS